MNQAFSLKKDKNGFDPVDLKNYSLVIFHNAIMLIHNMNNNLCFIRGNQARVEYEIVPPGSLWPVISQRRYGTGFPAYHNRIHHAVY